jgi:hypothetical protein
VVTGRALSTREISDVISAEVLEEINSDLEFTIALQVTLRGSPLDSLNKEVPNSLILHRLNNLSANLTEHKVSLLIFEGIMQA